MRGASDDRNFGGPFCPLLPRGKGGNINGAAIAGGPAPEKYFPTGAGLLHAVDDVSFTLEQGKTLGVVGESGCGKSTLGRVLLHLLESTDGKILFEGKDITRVDRAELSRLRRNMQIIFRIRFRL